MEKEGKETNERTSYMYMEPQDRTIIHTVSVNYKHVIINKKNIRKQLYSKGRENKQPQLLYSDETHLAKKTTAQLYLSFNN